MLRAKLDPWLAAKCEEAGALIMPGVRVDRVLTEGTRVVGVQAGDDELRAHVVVAADGVNSFIAQDAGLRKKAPLHHLAVGVKSVVSLPRKTIEERFNLTGDEGAAIAAVGDCTAGVGGGGFLYTNIDSLSIGIVVRLDDLTAKKKVVTDVFDHFLEHRFIAPYLEGGELLEYGCHLVAEGGLDMVGDIVMDGMVVVGDAAGLTLNTGLTVRGMDLAVGSAVAAAEAIGSALDQKNTSKAALAAYREKLFASYVGKDMETYAKAPGFLETDRMYKEYGELLANVLYGAFNHDLQPREHLAQGGSRVAGSFAAEDRCSWSRTGSQECVRYETTDRHRAPDQEPLQPRRGGKPYRGRPGDRQGHGNRQGHRRLLPGPRVQRRARRDHRRRVRRLPGVRNLPRGRCPWRAEMALSPRRVRRPVPRRVGPSVRMWRSG